MITTELTYLDYPVMIDLETAGLSPNAPIAAIGAVRFNPEGGPTVGPHAEFYVAVNLVGQAPRDASSVYLWMEQSDEARAAVREGTDGMPLGKALTPARSDVLRPSAYSRLRITVTPSP